MQARLVGEEEAVAPPSALGGQVAPFFMRVFARARALWDQLRAGPVAVEPYQPGVTKLLPLLWRPALLGFVAVTALVIGASQPSSPFTLTKVPGSWFFGIPPRPLVSGLTSPPGQGLFIGIVLVYAGMVLMFRAWYDIYKVTARHPGIPARKLAPVFALWVLPLLVVAPLFSQDAYSYAAQGEMMSHGINPYSYGPAILGVNSWVSPVDPLWQNVTSPYGPLFLGAAGSIVSLTGHNELATVVGLRLLALAGVVMIGVFLPRLARSYGFDGSTAFTLAVLNPLVLLHFVAGAHNDALMLGFLVAGLAMARSGRPVIGVVLVALGACVKVPAAIGIVYIGWEWLGDRASWRDRLRPLVSAALIAGAVMEAISAAVGLGWGWVTALGNPGTVESWLDPATAVGLSVGRVLRAAGITSHTLGVLSIARGLFFVAAAVIGLRLLLRSNRQTSGRALGITMLLVTVLGPVMQPWYLAWGIVMLAVVADTRLRNFLVALSFASCFLGLPGGVTLLDELTVANPLLVVGAAVMLLAVVAVALGPSVRRGLLAAARERVAAPAALSGRTEPATH